MNRTTQFTSDVSIEELISPKLFSRVQKSVFLNTKTRNVNFTYKYLMIKSKQQQQQQ